MVENLPIVEEFRKDLKHIMDTLANLQSAIAAEDTVIASVVALITGMAKQIAALPPDAAAIAALAADVQNQTNTLSAAVTANTLNHPTPQVPVNQAPAPVVTPSL